MFKLIRILPFILALLASSTLKAKYVKFAVDMTGQTINATGVHVMGDFQDEAGFPDGDWQPNTTLMTMNADNENIYSVVVNIPAFRKYEYRYLNGDQSYETEFVPIPSRVGYDFIDNRWLYVDSLSDDTTYVGAILFSGNAPQGLTLMRFLVDMQSEASVNSSGIHVVGDFQGWNAASTFMYSFIPSVYEIIAYDSIGTHNYHFINGNAMSSSEVVPGECSSSGERFIELISDSVLNVVCFNSCSACAVSGLQENEKNKLAVFPNPSSGTTTITFHNAESTHARILDACGKCVMQFNEPNASRFEFQAQNLATGFYLIQLMDAQQHAIAEKKLIIE